MSFGNQIRIQFRTLRKKCKKKWFLELRCLRANLRRKQEKIDGEKGIRVQRVSKVGNEKLRRGIGKEKVIGDLKKLK